MTDETQKPKLTPELVAAGIAERCYSDSDFRQSFIDNPKTCLEEACGKKFPGEVEIVACENNDSKWYIPVPQSDAREISEKDLAKIAGGEFAVLATTAVIVGLVVATGIGVVGGIAISDLVHGDAAFSSFRGG